MTKSRILVEPRSPTQRNFSEQSRCDETMTESVSRLLHLRSGYGEVVAAVSYSMASDQQLHRWLTVISRCILIIASLISSLFCVLSDIDMAC